MRRLFDKFKRTEKGQSIVEFAFIVPVLLILCLMPVDFYRYISMKTLLSSAASESVGQVTYDSILNNTLQADIHTTLAATYGDRLEVPKVVINASKGSTVTNNYNYYVYRSDLAAANPGNFSAQFQDRASNYTCTDVTVQFSYPMSAVTPWGAAVLGSNFIVQSPEYTRSVYSGGYTP